ncbi:MAG TPA: GMC family oxidoreductase [Longimicrobiales bacterium]|nr:GMC family oxidoreductase [Longimicrobiales bacterium]
MMYDAIVIGSGFGGALAAYPLVHAGWKVLMLERGDWVARGPQCWSPDGVRDLTPYYDRTTPYTVRGDDRMQQAGVHCVGGASVFYGGVSLRFREQDFGPEPQERAAGARWPFGYDTLEPYYAAAERLIGVAGEAGTDPTEPWRSTAYPQRVPPLSRTACRIADAGARLGLTPFRLPLALNHTSRHGQNTCISCNTCDGYACAIGAKNDIASAILPELIAHGMRVLPHTAATRLVTEGRRITGVETIDTRTHARRSHDARFVIVAAGALATPHLLLASGLQHMSSAPAHVGATLMRHCNSIVFGIFPRRLDPAREFHKQVGFNDLYLGDGNSPALGRLGTIQQIHAPPVGLVRTMLPGPLARVGERLLDRMTGLIAIAADTPQQRNCVELMDGHDALGMPRARVSHRYTARDRAARRVLAHAAARVLSEAGALVTFTMPIRTFSHGLGTVRMGEAEAANPLDATNRFRGIDNLYVTDASALPTAGGVNPSLTIAAVAYRAGCLLAAQHPVQRRTKSRIQLEVIHA